METELLPKDINLESGFVAVAIVVLALALIGWLNRKPLAAWFRDWRIQRCLNSIGSEQIRNLVCPDGLDGSYQLDRLALTNDAVVLVIYKAFGGNIFCAERISEWTQVVGQKSFKFGNPLFELENQLTALRLILGNVPVSGYLIFNHDAQFPKGHPDCVLRQDRIPEHLLSANCGQPRKEVLAVWDKLKELQLETVSDEGIGVKT
jgi:hypothetical protein